MNGNPSKPNELERIIHAPEGELPSDTVSSPVMRSTGNASHMTYCVVLLALIIADTLACVRAVANTVLVAFGKAPDRCRKACRLIVCQRTRATCGNPCCLPHDHGSVWNHTCPDHVQLGGRVSSFEYNTFMMFRWWQRVISLINSACRMATKVSLEVELLQMGVGSPNYYAIVCRMRHSKLRWSRAGTTRTT